MSQRAEFFFCSQRVSRILRNVGYRRQGSWLPLQHPPVCPSLRSPAPAYACIPSRAACIPYPPPNGTRT